MPIVKKMLCNPQLNNVYCQDCFVIHRQNVSIVKSVLQFTAKICLLSRHFTVYNSDLVVRQWCNQHVRSERLLTLDYLPIIVLAVVKYLPY